MNKVNKKYVKFLALLLAVVIVIGMSACTTPEDPATDSPGTPTGGPSSGTSTTPASPGSSGGGDPGSEVTGPANPERCGGVLNMAWALSPQTFDPHYTTGWSSYIWSQNVYETALVRDAEGRLQPMVCDFELSDDFLTLKLWVREGVTFHNGAPVTIEDVVASLERADMVANVRNFFNGYTESREVSGGVATYTFESYNHNTLYYISGEHTWSAIIPKEICDKYGEDPIIEVSDAIGTGPYKLTEAQLGVVFVMDRYDGYVPVPEGATGMATPKYAYLDRINYWINDDDTSLLMALMNGEYDITQLDNEYSALAASNGIKTSPAPRNQMLYIPFNTKSDRPVNDSNLRKAIAAVLNYEDIRKFAWEGTETAEYCPMIGLYYTDKFNKADYAGAENTALARRYLEASGYDGEELVIIASTSHVNIWPIVQAQMEKIGIKSRVDYMDTNTFTATYGDNDNDYDMVFLSSTTISYVPSLLAVNFRTAFWGSERKDELFSTIAKEFYGNANSMAAWNELCNIWVDECPIINLGIVADMWYANGDLEINYNPGTAWEHHFNAYWNNPKEHIG